MKVLLLLLVVIGLAAADAWPGRGRRSADPENSKFKAREASPGYLLEEFLKRRSADPENSKFKAREASPGYLLEEFLKRRSADPAKRGIFDPPQKIPIGNGLCFYLDVIIPC
ncbi:uncharacterized protein LOC135372724 isoform X2 [Ornithodoros turicata]|uniref:uncharacterized protein LOC135372724 isoform X2 n=1 Tax=Ornithodoros turicata TaxID=34597 RepID=UPI0031386231